MIYFKTAVQSESRNKDDNITNSKNQEMGIYETGQFPIPEQTLFLKIKKQIVL